jgi:teichuronic acid biosynthesis glycosyltransferase TuaC
MPAPNPISILTATTLFPNPAKPSHGIFVETRLRKLLDTGLVRARVLAPVPWLPPLVRHNSLGRLSEIPQRREDRGVQILHPRYAVIPRIGMNVAPHLLARAFYRGISEILASGERIDLIDAHYFYPDGVAAVWAARKFGLPVVVTGRGTDLNLIPQYDAPRRLIHDAAVTADGLVTVCAALKEPLVGMGIDEARIRVLRNGVDLELFRPGDRAEARKKLGVQGQVLASVGHLTARKGHHHVIGALPTLPDATLLIAGEGEEKAALEAQAKELGVAARVRFLGALPQSQLRDVYNAADALVLASSREGWANVLLEAMACGTPVVASNIWGTPEVVSEAAAGVLMPSLDTAGVAQGVRQLMAVPPDRAETRRFAEGFGWEPTTQGQIDLFREILAKSG